jgi:hypothetical protein
MRLGAITPHPNDRTHRTKIAALEISSAWSARSGSRISRLVLLLSSSPFGHRASEGRKGGPEGGPDAPFHLTSHQARLIPVEEASAAFSTFARNDMTR